MNNFQVNKLEDTQLKSVVGGTDIIEDDGDFNTTIYTVDFIVEDEVQGF